MRSRTSERIELVARESTISIDRWLCESALYRPNAADLRQLYRPHPQRAIRFSHDHVCPA